MPNSETQTLTKLSWIHPRTGTQEQEGGVIAVLFHDGDSGRSDNTDPHSEDGADEVMLSVKAKRFNLGSIRAENLVSPTLRVL